MCEQASTKRDSSVCAATWLRGWLVGCSWSARRRLAGCLATYNYDQNQSINGLRETATSISHRQSRVKSNPAGIGHHIQLMQFPTPSTIPLSISSCSSFHFQRTEKFSLKKGLVLQLGTDTVPACSAATNARSRQRRPQPKLTDSPGTPSFHVYITF